LSSPTRILVFQPGKVGSSSVKESLIAAGVGAPIETPHIISRDGLDDAERKHRALGIDLPPWYELGRRLNQEIPAGEWSWKVVTIFRDPIARIMSGFFQEAARFHPDEFPEHGDWDYERIESHLLREFSGIEPATDFTFSWFDRELATVFGVDAYADPFDHDAGFVQLEGERCSVLVLQYEKLGAAFPAAAGRFFRAGEPIPLLHVHDSRDKPYSAMYQNIVESFRLPASTCEKLYSTRFTSHFFDASERRALIERWSR
jgi:hypothetical protein